MHLYMIDAWEENGLKEQRGGGGEEEGENSQSDRKIKPGFSVPFRSVAAFSPEFNEEEENGAQSDDEERARGKQEEEEDPAFVRIGPSGKLREPFLLLLFRFCCFCCF
jgi:hypothetical protein